MAKSLEISNLKQLVPSLNPMALVNGGITGKVLKNQN